MCPQNFPQGRRNFQISLGGSRGIIEHNFPFGFWFLDGIADIFWMIPIMGFCQFSLFSGYAIYFPELFPTRLRGTGVGFCYNTVRYLAAPAPILFGYLQTLMSFRTAAMLMSTVYLVGVVALIWAPETKGRPLPED